MAKRTTKIELTEDELQREREAAAVKAVRHFVEEELRPLIDQFRADLRRAAISRDLIPEQVLLDWLGISKKTLRQSWGVPHTCQKGNTRFYDWEEVEAHLRGSGEDLDE